MSRFRRVIHNVASGYAGLIAGALYSLASVPLALHYLSGEQFGLWALMVTIGGYLGLVDLGMSSSVARLLIDHKDDRGGGTYGSLIQTGCLVLLLQGLTVFAAGFLLSVPLADLLKIPAGLRADFILLLRWQSGILGFGFATRIFNHLLFSGQRVDITNYVQIATMALNYVMLWLFFHRGEGVFSLMWANLAGTLFSTAALGVACLNLQLFPTSGGWGSPTWRHFMEIFNYGKDIFLVAVGSQLIMTSQTIIITRMLGLEAAAAWSVGTKLFSLVSQIIWRISDVAGIAFSEMLVRKEHTVLRERYRSVLILTASLAGFGAVSYCLCNSLFVDFLVLLGRVKYDIQWPVANDVLLALWMVVMALLHCHNNFVLMTKQVGFMRYVYFLEGVVFFAAGLVSARLAGLPGVILSSVTCSVLFSGAYGTWRVSRYFELPIREVALQWLVPMLRVLSILAPGAVVVWWGTRPLHDSMLRLALHALFCVFPGAYVFLRFGLPQNFQRELLQRAPKGLNPVLRRVFASAQ